MLCLEGSEMASAAESSFTTLDPNDLVRVAEVAVRPWYMMLMHGYPSSPVRLQILYPNRIGLPLMNCFDECRP